jgi:hypothetical protein
LGKSSEGQVIQAIANFGGGAFRVFLGYANLIAMVKSHMGNIRDRKLTKTVFLLQLLDGNHDCIMIISIDNYLTARSTT